MFQSASDKQVEAIKDFDTVIGPLVKASGILESTGNVKISGNFKDGKIKIKGLLEVTPEAKIEADVQTEVLKVYGELRGNITAQQVIIGASGRVYGDINSGGNLIIESGGLFIGKSVMAENKASRIKTSPEKKEEE